MIEALKLALDALENHEGNYKLGDAGCDRHEAAITAIKEALAQRTWVGLTEQQRNDIENDFEVFISIHVFDAIEAKLKDKNS